ncbi:MAG: putative signal transducing protein [Acidimicrobiia bacterium]
MALVLLAEIGDSYEAELLAARLRSEGIESRLTGEPEGPYRLTLGAMALTKVWVEEGELERAQAILEEFEE